LKRNQDVEVLPPEKSGKGKHTAALNSISGVRREQARTFRAVVNGRIPSDEGARRIYMLKEVRASLESEPSAAEAGTIYENNISIIGVPHDCSVVCLFGAEVHVPNKILPELRVSLPPDAFTRPPSADPNIDPQWLLPPSGNAPPVLKVYENDAESDPMPPSAA
jgi:hypothetical protein